MCRALGLVPSKGRRPSGILSCILKKYWPGLYRVNPEDEIQKLALKWEDYQDAPCGAFAMEDGGAVPTHAVVVLKTFWVRFFFKAHKSRFLAMRVLCTSMSLTILVLCMIVGLLQVVRRRGPASGNSCLADDGQEESQGYMVQCSPARHLALLRRKRREEKQG